MKHFAFFVDNAYDSEVLRKNLVDFLNFNGVNTCNFKEFSTSVIKNIIDEEFRHDRFEVKTEHKLALQFLSSGQQRIAVLRHLLSQSPKGMMLFDVFSNVDKDTRAEIIETLNQLADEINFVQIFTRTADLLPFIHAVIMYDASKDMIFSPVSRNDFYKLSQRIHNEELYLKIPESYRHINFVSQHLIEMKDIAVSYGDRKILKNINWTINAGEFWQLKGPNGAGKSTLITMITGDNPKAYGQNMKLFGYKKGNGESIWDIKRFIGYFTPSMLNRFTRDQLVEEMIISGFNDSIGLYAEPTDIQRDLAHKWIQLLGSGFINKSFLALTPGHQRIVMVIRAIVKLPPLLILDEPTSDLDEKNTLLFVNLINTIATETNMAIIYVSHRDEPQLKPTHIFELISKGDYFSSQISTEMQKP